MKVFSGYCPSCGESVAVDVYLVGMDGQHLIPSVIAHSARHECPTEATA
jgi:hypothetical protein